MTAKIPIIHITDSAPNEGRASRKIPKIMENIPPSASNTLLPALVGITKANANWNIPITRAQAAMTYSNATAVIPGQAKATTPATIPTIPQKMSHARSPQLPLWVNANVIDKMPSAIA